ncbi:unnamed protein product, partial [Mesorhabditis spiculigera]
MESSMSILLCFLLLFSPKMLTYEKSGQSLWVFGYGSLIWNPGFSYEEKRRGRAIGFARRMYQGNTYHRGDDSLPGRVATLVQDSTSEATGMLFRIRGRRAIRAALAHLYEREVGNGYRFEEIPCVVEIDGRLVKTMALTCIAYDDNEYYLGPDEVSKMAMEIAKARGLAGPNHEYVLKLAEHHRLLFPDHHDNHLFELETMVREGLMAVAA